MLASQATGASSNVDLATAYLPSDSDLPGTVNGGSVSVGISVENKAPEKPLDQPPPNPEEMRLQGLYPSLTKVIKVPVVPDEVTKKTMQEAEAKFQTFEFTKLLCYDKELNPLRGVNPALEASLLSNTRIRCDLDRKAIEEAKKKIIKPGCLEPTTSYRLNVLSTIFFGAATIVTLFVPEQALGISPDSAGAVTALVIARIISVVGAAVGPILQSRENAIASEATRDQDIAEKRLDKKLATMRSLIKTQRLGFKALGKELIQEWVRSTPGHGNERQRNKIIDQRIFTKEDLYKKEASKIALLKTIAESWKNSLTELDRYFTSLTSSQEDAARILSPLDEAISAIQFDADKGAISADPLNKERIAMANNPMHTYLVRLRTETKEWLRERIETMITERAEKKQREPFFHYKKQGAHLLEDGQSSGEGQSQAGDSRRRTLAAPGLPHSSGSTLASHTAPSKQGRSPRPQGGAPAKNASKRASQSRVGMSDSSASSGKSDASAKSVTPKLTVVTE